MTETNATNSHLDQPASRRFGICGASGEWYLGQSPNGHRWGPVESAGVWTTRDHADAALPALKTALRRSGELPIDIDTLTVVELTSAGHQPFGTRYVPDFDALRLTTIGSRGLGIAVTPSALEENPSGATLWLELHDGPLAVSFTALEAQQLATWLIHTVKSEGPIAHPTTPRTTPQETP